MVPPEAVHPDLQLQQQPLLEKEKQCLCRIPRSQLASMERKLETPQMTRPEKLLVAVEPP